MPRAFTCIDIPPDIAEKLSNTQEDIGVGRPVKPEKMHITLEFFKNISSTEVEETVKKFEDLELQPFNISIKGLGVFPSKSHIRVLWAGAKSNRIEDAYQETSDITPPSSNKHDFHPHITLSRIKNLRKGDKKAIHQALEDFSGKKFGEFNVSEIKLYESLFDEKGSSYREIYVKNL